MSGLPSAKDYILLMDAEEEEHLVMDWIRIAFWQHLCILMTLSLMLPGSKSCKAQSTVLYHHPVHLHLILHCLWF